MGIKGEWKFVQPQIGGTNLYQYNGIELNDDFGLNWNMAMFRTYDPSIGRWGQVDPLAQLFLEVSAYNGMGNNPIIFNDPLGLAPEGSEGREEGRVSTKKKKGDDDWIPFVNTYGRITLIAEEGDNASTLKDFFGSEENGKKYVRGAYFNEHMEYSKGDKIEFNKTNKFSQTMDFYQKNKDKIDGEYTYDCKELCRYLIMKGIPKRSLRGTGTTPDDSYRYGLDMSKREEINEAHLIFGTTFAWWWTDYLFVGDHAAVFFGKDKSGMKYFFSKNGERGPLVIMSEKELSKVYTLYWNPWYYKKGKK